MSKAKVVDMTNVEFVTNMMDFSQNGAMMQLFIVQAIEHYADQVIKAPQGFMGSGLINEAAWRRTAVEAKQRLDAKYGPA